MKVIRPEVSRFTLAGVAAFMLAACGGGGGGSSSNGHDGTQEEEGEAPMGMVEPEPDKVAVADDGSTVALELFLVRMRDGFQSYEDASELAEEFNADVVGSTRAGKLYQFRIPSEDLSETAAHEEELREHPNVEWALADFALAQGHRSEQWDEGERETGQLESNAVTHEQAAASSRSTREIYTDAWNASPIADSGEPVQVGILELTPRIDDSLTDFSDLSPHIELQAEGGVSIGGPDNAATDVHASMVTGIMVARTGNYDFMDPGTYAGGLLDYIGDEGGDFVVHLASPKTHRTLFFLGPKISESESLIEDHGVTIMNLSFGGTAADAVNINDLTCAQIESCGGEGLDRDKFEGYANVWEDHVTDYPNVLFVAAAGNSGFEIDKSVDVPAGLSQTNDNVVAVSGHGTSRGPFDDAYSPKTNFGDVVDIAAAWEAKTFSHWFVDNNGTPINRSTCGGTSCAAPLVAATAAAMKSIAPDLTPVDILTIMRQTAFGGGDILASPDYNLTLPLSSSEITEHNSEFAEAGDSAVLNVAGALDAVNEYVLGEDDDETMSDGMVYQEDFGADPGYKSLKPDDVFWDAENEWYNITTKRYSESGVLRNAYIGISPEISRVVDPTQESFRITMRVNPKEPGYANYPRVMLADSSELEIGEDVEDVRGLGLRYCIVCSSDRRPEIMQLRHSGDGLDAFDSETVSPDTWYVVRINYESQTGQLDWTVEEEESAEVFVDVSEQNVELQRFDQVVVGHAVSAQRYNREATALVDFIEVKVFEGQGL